MAKITGITPFVMTHDLSAALTFYCEVLGFVCTFQQENYAYVRQNPGGALRIIEVAQDCEIGEQMIYFDCDDVDALFDTLRPRLEPLPKGHVRPPFDQPYGMREFHVKDPDNCLLLYGADIPSSR